MTVRTICVLYLFSSDLIVIASPGWCVFRPGSRDSSRKYSRSAMHHHPDYRAARTVLANREKWNLPGLP